ncbi:uncharacterized protein IL334_006543 [Kwoniella shivajii]|uniref:Uncharacterized protein n=1 Tax=Kwoniella shivajii TaxID=564305 RepID=A0ABZ1D6U5_9TREE|nr:hypothetical protein IL334_006543 [Kwoniella shivajii]
MSKSKFVVPPLTPLPEEVYPVQHEAKKPDQGYYVALGLVMSVWMITPLCCAYLLWYTLLSNSLSRGSLTSTLFAAYSITEILFAIYTSHLISRVQTPSPPSTLPISERTKLFLRVIHSGLTYPVPPRGITKHAHDHAEDGDGIQEGEFRDAYVERGEEDSQKGLISVADLHHIKEREYEESIGIRERKRVGKLSKQEENTINCFVENKQGEREEKLRDQIENQVLPNTDNEEWGYEGIINENNELVHLHHWDKRAIDFRERLRTWFNYTPWDSIKRGNIQMWLAWTCFNTTFEEISTNENHIKFLQYVVELLEARTGTIFEEGYNDKIELSRLTIDKVNAKGRPLILYALTNAINLFLQKVVYPYQGMGLYREGDVEYLIRIPKGWTPEKGRTEPNAIPVVYLHGLGFGLLQSHFLIKHLISSLPSHPILIPLSPYTAQSLFHHRHLRPWTRQQLVDAMKNICTQWGFWDEGARGSMRGGVSLLSHSNGSVAHGWILKDCPSLVKRSTFVDPVVFCLWEGDVCYNFCYRKPSSAIELLLYYFIASEVGIAHYIQRHFDWADNTLFFDEIPNATDSSKTAFFLGAKDVIIDATRVRRYLERHGVTHGIHWDPLGGHGDGLIGPARDRVIMFAGTGTTNNWDQWLKKGRRKHSIGQDEFLERAQGK